MSDGAIIAIIGLGTVLASGVPATVTALLSRRVVAEARDHAQSAAADAAETKATIGVKNGNGDLMTQIAKVDEKIGKVDEKVDQLEERTHITRVGGSEPEELRSYIQERMHLVLNAQALLALKVDWMWRAAKNEGWDLPDLPSMKDADDGP